MVMNFNLPPQLQQQHNPQQYVIKFSKFNEAKRNVFERKSVSNEVVLMYVSSFLIFVVNRFECWENDVYSVRATFYYRPVQFYELLELQSMDSNLNLYLYLGFAYFCKSFVFSHVKPLTIFLFQFHSNVWRQFLPRVNFLQGYSRVWFIYLPEDSGNCIHLHTWHRQTKTAKNKNHVINSGIIRTFLE